MMLKRSTTESKPSFTARLVRAGVLSLVAASAVGALATGCLDRPVVKAKPTTSNLFVDQIVQTGVDKIDLLFMIDNSVSMADKQEILKAAVPVLVSRLVDPICVDSGTGAATNGTNSQGCAAGSQPEFNPISDIHIGIVSSSLGAHGGTGHDVCASGMPNDTLDDKGRLIGAMRPPPGGAANPTAALNFDVARTANGQGFLAWDPFKTKGGNVSDAKTLNTAFQDMIVATGEHGCGFEASLESWYRFLVDPEPPAMVTKVTPAPGKNPITVRGSKLAINKDGTPGACTGCDDVLLAQRKAFLRPDSLVAIVMLSDENDCSIRDDGSGWFVGAGSRMPRSTAACDKNPNDRCCRSCASGEMSPPADCPALSDDATCKNKAGGTYATWDSPNDSANLRCYNQHQRFGFDLLYPTQRYVDALKNTTIELQSTPGTMVVNPLYDNAGSDKAPRIPGLVFLAGIVGVPWQDIADDASLKSKDTLNYLTAQELLAKDRWTTLLGNPNDPAGPVPPSDPFMIETPKPRSGMNPIVNVAITPATSMDPHANVINGHEQVVPAGTDVDDLQYACTFPLTTPKTCANGDSACDCSPDMAGSSAKVMAANSPLCQGGATINTQTSAKAYPGARELQVLKDLGNNAIVASICPKVTKSDSPSSDPNYGYNPAVGAIIERLKEALQGKCLPRPIQTDDKTHEVLCKVIEAQKSGCNCGVAGRGVADAAIQKAVQDQLKKTGNCGGTGQAACTTWCQCEIKQESGADLAACQSNSALSTPGYCYIDKSAETVNGGAAKAAVDMLLNKCPSNEQQLLRFVDADSAHKTPAAGAVAFIACLGAAVVEVGGGTAGGAAN
ncbi:MAG: hypothetical protein ABJB12_06330 [Pseudomonadota bacterium]